MRPAAGGTGGTARWYRRFGVPEPVRRGSLLGRQVAVGRDGGPRTLGQAIGRVAGMTGADLGGAVGYYYLVRLAGARIVPRALRLVLYRSAGVRVRWANIAPGLFVGGPPSHLTIGQGTSINVDCFFDCLARVTLGRNAMVAMGVMIVTSDHDLDPDGLPSPETVGRDVVIGDRAWLGARAVVLPGVTVGEGAVVSAGAVVARDCRPYGLYAGVPARLVKQLKPGAGAGTGEAAATG